MQGGRLLYIIHSHRNTPYGDSKDLHAQYLVTAEDWALRIGLGHPYHNRSVLPRANCTNRITLTRS